MLIPSYLFVFFLLAQTCAAYTVVLLSGKQVVGSIVSDQDETVVIRDAKGVILSFQKTRLNLQAMSALNNTAIEKSQSSTMKEPQRRERSIVELASDLKKSRTGQARTFTQSDLDGLPELSILGNEQANLEPSVKQESPTSDRTWHNRILTLKNEVYRLRERKIGAESSCEASRKKQYAARTHPGTKPVDLLSTYRETPQCARLTEIATQLSDAESRLDTVREDARRAGVSWQYIE